MPIPVIISQIDIYGRVIKEWDVLKLRNTTIFIPKENAKYCDADVDSDRDSFLKDFLDLGNFLFDHYSEKYKPLLYSELRRKHNSFEKRITWSDSAVAELLSDANSPYFSDAGEETTAMLLQFINKYGFSTPRYTHEDAVIATQSVWKEWLLEDLNINRNSFCILSGTFLIQDLLATFVSYCRPDYEREKIIEVYGEEVYNEVECQTNISLHQSYDHENKKFITRYTVFSVLDYLEMLLATINSGESQQKIYICPNCNKSFISSNARAIYCSSVCRNRSNVKRNYYKKKNAQ